MMMSCLSLSISCCLLLCATSGWAWNKDYQTEYVLGDSDSRLTAKQQALKQIQLQAMQEAGTYIQGQTQLLNDKLDEKINQVSAAIVKLQVLTEHFELTATGQQKLRLMARANVDESVLQQRVQVLQQETNQAKQQQPILTAIQQEQQKLMLDNQLLRRQLQVLSQQGQLPTNISPTPTEQKDLSLLCAVKLPKQCSPLEIESLGKDNGQMSVAKRVIDSY